VWFTVHPSRFTVHPSHNIEGEGGRGRGEGGGRKALNCIPVIVQPQHCLAFNETGGVGVEMHPCHCPLNAAISRTKRTNLELRLYPHPHPVPVPVPLPPACTCHPPPSHLNLDGVVVLPAATTAAAANTYNTYNTAKNRTVSHPDEREGFDTIANVELS
jgi:hypothetical protein